MNELEGKVVLVTGAGRGRGRALAEAFARQGAFVAANDITPVNLDEWAGRWQGKVKVYPEDVAKKIAIQTVVKQVEDDFGRIDILVNHASVEPRSPLLDMDEWDWHRVLDVNLTGAFLTMQVTGRIMRESGSGVMINLMGAAPPDIRGEAAYLAGLYGLVAVTRSASAELAPFGIRVHAILAGLPEFHHSEAGLPSDPIEAVFYLCSHPALNGQIVNLEEPWKN